MTVRSLIVMLFCLFCLQAQATKLFIPMDADGQSNHLKAYGIAFAALQSGTKVDWLLNYRGGSYAMDFSEKVATMCSTKGVTFTKMKDGEYNDIKKEVEGLKYAGAVVQLIKAPKIAVYTPLNKEPWDDAVTLALTYAEIPFDKIYANEVLGNELTKYDWLHLHHEDFTGQYGKFWNQFRAAQWYQNDRNAAERMAAKHGFKKVQQLQLAVVQKIRAFVKSGGNLFAMCSATDTYDIALAGEGVDICETQFDDDPMDTLAQSKLNFKKCLAFRNFTLETSPYVYEYSSIDNTNFRKIDKASDFFTLNAFPSRLDQVPAMLCQNHTNSVKGFMGQTTAFRNEVLKPNVLVMGGNKALNEARYIHGDLGKGTWTFYGGHDPEDYQHAVGASPTDLAFHTASPGYRLILNNVLCPAAKKQDVPLVEIGNSKTAGDVIDTSALQETNKIKISSNPDPSLNELILTIPPNMGKGPWRVVVTDPTGVEALSKTFQETTIRINMQPLSPGAYLVQVNGTYAGRVIKD